MPSGTQGAKLASAGPVGRGDDGRMQAPSASDRLADALTAVGNPRLDPVVRDLRQSAAGTDPVADPVADYRAVHGALAHAAQLAAESTGDADRYGLGELLSGRLATQVTMAAAVAVVESAGAVVDRGDDDRSHLARARRWRGYAAGPVSDLHRRCGQDISRGSLRLLGAAARDRLPGDVRVELQRRRLRLIADGRSRWTAVRRELEALPAPGGAFEHRVRERLLGLFAAADAASAGEFADVVGTVPAGTFAPWPRPRIPDPPAVARPDERRLSAVLGAGFGLGVALATMRLLTGLRGLGELGGAVCGVLVGLALTCWVVVVRGRLQRRAALDRWVAESIAVVRSAADDHLAHRYLDAQQYLVSRGVRARASAHHKSTNW